MTSTAAGELTLVRPARAGSRYLSEGDGTSEADDLRRKGRAQRYALRRGLRKYQPNRHAAVCGLYPSPLYGGYVDVHHGDHGATFAGVKVCKRPWLCPTCSATIRQARSREIEQGATMHLAVGGGLAFGTFTLHHTITTRLKDSLTALRDAYRYVRQDRSVRRLFSRLGVDGAIRALEITYGLNGWHPHLHLLWFTARPLTRDECSEVQAALYLAWARALERLGWVAPSAQRGVLVLPVSLVRGGAEGIATYLSKVQDAYGAPSSLSREMARGDLKKGRKQSRLPFELAASAVAGDKRDLARWHEYAEATHRAHITEWSRGLKGRLGVLEVDDETAYEQETARGPVIASLTAQEYRLVARWGREAYVLDLAEQGGAVRIAKAVAALQRREELERRRADRAA